MMTIACYASHDTLFSAGRQDFVQESSIKGLDEPRGTGVRTLKIAFFRAELLTLGSQ